MNAPRVKPVETVYPDDEVVLLWGFADRKLIPQVQRACAAERLPYAEVHALRVPEWAAWFRGQPFVLDCASGEYGGTLSPDVGGTAGRPRARRPRMAEAVDCRLDGITDMLLLEFPYWVPVRVAV